MATISMTGSEQRKNCFIEYISVFMKEMMW